jgi:hypothetical protein
MKNILNFFLAAFLVFSGANAQTYSAKIIVWDQSFVVSENPNSTETNVNVEVQLFQNDTLIPKSSNYYYEIFRRAAGIELEPFVLENEGYGSYRGGTHAYTDSTRGDVGIIDWYGVISELGEGHDITVTTDTIRTPWWKVVADQKKSDNSSYGDVKYWKGNGFTNNHSVPDTFFIPRYSPKVLLADTNLTSTGTEKYYQWYNVRTNSPDWYNNYIFLPVKPIEKITSNLIGANTSAFAIIIDSVQLTVSNTFEFLDPWLRDSTNAYGNLNRNYDAVFRKQTAPFSPNTNSSGAGSEYKGIFLNQYPFTMSDPYYMIRIKKNGDFNGKNMYFQNWSLTNAELTTPTQEVGEYYETAVVFEQSNSSVTAYYKGSLFSNHSTAFSNTSQRKVVNLSTSYGSRLFVVYESMGKIWLEYSTNNGQTWELGNNRQPLNSSSAKIPSLAAFNNSNTLAIVYQESDDGDSWITCQQYDIYTNLASSPVMIGYTRSSNANSNPVVTQSYTGNNNDARLMFAWEQNDGIHYMITRTILDTIKFGTINCDNQPKVSGTDANSYSPSLAGGWTTQNYNFHLAWSQNNTDIKYVKIQQLISSNFESINFGSIENVSSGAGYSSNYSPSIISIVSSAQSNDSRISWVGRRLIEEEGMGKNQAEGTWEYNALFRGTPVGGSNPFFQFGESDVTSSSVNKVATTYTQDLSYVVGWSQGNGNYYTKNSQLSGQTAIPGLSSGYSLQLSQSTDTIRAFAQQSNTGYYTLNQSTQGLGKMGNPLSSFSGREGIISLNAAQIYFGIGDVLVNGETVPFSDITDTTCVNTLSKMNSLLETQPFVLNSASNFTYAVQYGISDSISPLVDFASGKEVTFKVELVDLATNEVIGLYDVVKYDENNICRYKNVSYQVLTNDMSNRTVKLRLVVTPNFASQFSVANKTSNSFTLTKSGRNNKVIGYKGALGVSEFALDQNYPNPFNPATTISFAIPKAGNVRLTIFDAIGREVALLVNDYRETGRYTAAFDASKFASGMYIYKLTSGSFSEVKKMMFVK